MDRPTNAAITKGVIVIAGLCSLLPIGTAEAQDTEILVINATVLSRAELTLSPTTINFPDASPTTTPSIPANETVAVTANVRTSGIPTLQVLAAGDLLSGTDTIAISNVTWTASAAPFIAGSMSTVTDQDAATFSTGSAQYSGTYTFALANLWTYAVGSYTTTATYTLTAP